MREKSPYEGTFDNRLGGTTCLGIITSVDSKRRTCRVKTGIGSKNVNDNLDLLNVQFLHSASHKEGDEDTFIPRIGSIALIMFVNSQAFIVGYYQQVAEEGNYAPPEKEDLLPGDKVTKTKAGNKFIMRSGGSVEIEATRKCRTYWSPSSDRMTTVADNFELDTAGGTMHWLESDDESTRLLFRCHDFTAPSDNTVEVGVGSNPDGSLLSVDVGPAADDGSISTTKFHMDVKADGTTTVVINSKCTLTIDASGNVNLATDGSVSASVKGSTSVTTEGSLNLTTKGSTTMKTTGSTTLDSTGAVTVKSAASLTLNVSGNIVPGNLVTDNEMNIDPLTGIPLVGHPKINVP